MSGFMTRPASIFIVENFELFISKSPPTTSGEPRETNIAVHLLQCTRPKTRRRGGGPQAIPVFHRDVHGFTPNRVETHDTLPVMEIAHSAANVTALREGDLPQYRTPPHNTEAEQALLGAMLVNNAAHARVSEFLFPEHFADAVHGRIYAAISKLVERGQVANPVALKNLFDQDGALAEIGGAAYLARLAGSVVTIINAEDYGRTIHDLYL